jgi:hypothetical protein
MRLRQHQQNRTLIDVITLYSAQGAAGDEEFMNSEIQACFITAPAGANLDVLTSALSERRLRVVTPESLKPEETFGANILNLIASVDLVIGVLTSGRHSHWVLFELGVAWSQGKRVILFAPPNSVHLPSSIRGFLTVRAKLSNREAVAFALDQILAAPQLLKTPVSLPKETKPLGEAAGKYLAESLRLARNEATVGLTMLVGNALTEAGVDVVTYSKQTHELGVDLAIWSDALQPSVGNPLLVEIKVGLSTAKATTDAAQRLSKYVIAAGGLWGLLLYKDFSDDLRGLPANVLALDLASLFQRLEEKSFEEIIRDLRNRRAHGRTC